MNVIVEVMLAMALGIFLFGTTIGFFITGVVIAMRAVSIYGAYKQAKKMQKEMMGLMGGLVNDKGTKKRRASRTKRK